MDARWSTTALPAVGLNRNRSLCLIYDTRGDIAPAFGIYLSQTDWHIQMMDDDDEVGGELLEFIFGMHAPQFGMRAPQIVKLLDNRSVIVSYGDTLWGFGDPIGRMVFATMFRGPGTDVSSQHAASGASTHTIPSAIPPRPSVAKKNERNS